MRKVFHFLEHAGFTLLTHNVFDSFCQPRIVSVSEDSIIPAGTDGEAVELDVVLEDMMIILHSQVIDSVFCIGGRVDRAKLNMEGADENRPIVHPIQGLIGVQDQWLKIF